MQMRALHQQYHKEIHKLLEYAIEMIRLTPYFQMKTERCTLTCYVYPNSENSTENIHDLYLFFIPIEKKDGKKQVLATSFQGHKLCVTAAGQGKITITPTVIELGYMLRWYVSLPAHATLSLHPP